MAKKILLIESDDSIRRLLKASLTEHDYDVILAAEGGDEGIILAVTESPDLILIDTDLPVLNGWQVIKILKASTVTQRIPIIALMTPTMESKWSRVLDSGCNACELKPIDYESLFGKIKALTEPISISTDADIPSVSAPNSVLFPTRHIPSQSIRRVPKGLGSWVGHDPGRTILKESMVVYVDDSPLDSQAMAEIVERAGYGYDNISEPLKALPLLLEIRPRLIFVNLVMPYTNGYEMCAQIRRASAFKKTPIVIVTNNDGIIDRVRARFVGASAFFSKPLEEERVVKVLKNYLDPVNTVSKGFHQRRLLPFV